MLPARVPVGRRAILLGVSEDLRDPSETRPPTAVGGIADDPDQRTEFPLDDWSAEDRALLDRLLTGEAVPHSWQGGTVVVPRGSQHLVDDLIDQVEMAATPGTEAEPEVHSPVDGREADPDEEWDTEGWDDDVDAQEVLGEAFLAADRLARRSSDPEGVLAMVEVHGTMTEMRLPFGFDPAVWDDLVAHVAVIARLLTDESGSEDTGGERIEELAGDLRARLRPLV